MLGEHSNHCRDYSCAGCECTPECDYYEDDLMTAEEFWEYLDELDKQMEENL